MIALQIFFQNRIGKRQLGRVRGRTSLLWCHMYGKRGQLGNMPFPPPLPSSRRPRPEILESRWARLSRATAYGGNSFDSCEKAGLRIEIPKFTLSPSIARNGETLGRGEKRTIISSFWKGLRSRCFLVSDLVFSDLEVPEVAFTPDKPNHNKRSCCLPGCGYISEDPSRF